MQMYHYEIVEEPRDDVYRQLISQLAMLCSIGSVTEPLSPDLSWLGKTILAQLDADIIEIRKERIWPGAWYNELAQRQIEGSSIEYLYKIHLFRITPRSTSVLLQAVGGLYDWDPPDLPEHLCLLRADRTPCLWSITDEQIGYLYASEEEIEWLRQQVSGLRVVKVPLEDEWEEPIWWPP